MNYLATVVDKTSTMDIGTGALYSLVSILMVFIILLLIIGLTTLVFKGVKLLPSNKKAAKTKTAPTPSVNAEPKSKEITDDDMMVAVLIATIDYRNEIKQDVRLVSVREVK